MNTTIPVTITIGPDTQSGEGGVCWHVATAEDSIDSGGAARGPRDSESPDAWLAYARRQLAGMGIRWASADVRPYGWSQGAGHAPQGIVVRAEMRR